LTIAGYHAELLVTAISAYTLRVSVVPDGGTSQGPDDLVLPRKQWPEPLARFWSRPAEHTLKWGEYKLNVSTEPLSLSIVNRRGRVVQSCRVDPANGRIKFEVGSAPIFGLGEGGPQFDRRGSRYPMKHGQNVPDLATNGARMPIPWLISTMGWALFFHHPIGSLDLLTDSGSFTPVESAPLLPVDFFFVVAPDPKLILREYAQLTGHPHMPPIWSLGYQQSHRTLASREEVLAEARRFRDHKLPCDVLIYLGTGFCPSGWNTGHGSFAFNPKVFDDPARIFQELHEQHFRVVVHVVNPPQHLEGRVHDEPSRRAGPDNAAIYWKKHEALMRLGVDGWWADEGDALSEKACLVRNRMYWEGQIKDRPNRRPYALHRNGYAGLQRYGWLWSGDIDSTWKTLRHQVAVGINTGLSGIPYWGTDTGGFVPTKELTGELYVRWFQFSAFCPLFRSHGRAWKLRLPWGWNTGEYGPTEIEGYRSPAALPDPSELHNPNVERICRKYLNLRYQLLPYTYTVVRESHDTGLPVMRALWIHYPSDARAIVRDDEYLWGRDILVAPVIEKGAALRRVYLPEGEWFDFWTEEKVEGGREIDRPVDLETLPLYVRSGSILIMGPIRQYALQDNPQPLSAVVYPGTDGEFMLYEDDGQTFDYRRGEMMWTLLQWNDRANRVTLSLKEGSKRLRPFPRQIEFRLAGSSRVSSANFDGRPIDLLLKHTR
jgi:alpha-glucosidase/alpha-D-xyloside xylohydrolase